MIDANIFSDFGFFCVSKLLNNNVISIFSYKIIIFNAQLQSTVLFSEITSTCVATGIPVIVALFWCNRLTIVTTVSILAT